MAYKNFTDGDPLLGAELNALENGTAVQVTSDAERTALPTAVKMAYQNGVLYARDSTNAWKIVATGDELASFLPLSGGTITGTTKYWGAISEGTHIATKNYVDVRDANYLPLSGGTINGPAKYTGTTFASTDLVNKGYVDAKAAAEADSVTLAALGLKAGRTGPYNINESASTGLIYVNHGLGVLPRVVIVSADDDGGACTIFASVYSKNTTQIVCHMRNIGYEESHVYLNWLVMK